MFSLCFVRKRTLHGTCIFVEHHQSSSSTDNSIIAFSLQKTVWRHLVTVSSPIPLFMQRHANKFRGMNIVHSNFSLYCFILFVLKQLYFGTTNQRDVEKLMCNEYQTWGITPFSQNAVRVRILFMARYVTKHVSEL